jgi:hypothetical protein
MARLWGDRQHPPRRGLGIDLPRHRYVRRPQWQPDLDPLRPNAKSCRHSHRLLPVGARLHGRARCPVPTRGAASKLESRSEDQLRSLARHGPMDEAIHRYQNSGMKSGCRGCPGRQPPRRALSVAIEPIRRRRLRFLTVERVAMVAIAGCISILTLARAALLERTVGNT